jgi:hypothetical protein
MAFRKVHSYLSCLVCPLLPFLCRFGRLSFRLITVSETHTHTHTHTYTHTPLCRTPLDRWSARRKDLYPTTRNNGKKQAAMPPVGLEPAVLEIARPQTHAFGRTTNEIGEGQNFYSRIACGNCGQRRNPVRCAVAVLRIKHRHIPEWGRGS